MGDNGKLYIPEDEVPEYKALLREADLILPNQFEAESVQVPLVLGEVFADMRVVGYYQIQQSQISPPSQPLSKSYTKHTKSRTLS
jgi:hypothetical protein